MAATFPASPPSTPPLAPLPDEEPWPDAYVLPPALSHHLLDVNRIDSTPDREHRPSRAIDLWLNV